MSSTNTHSTPLTISLTTTTIPTPEFSWGRQLVSLACTEHQFFDIFKGYIHHSKKNVYKCVFRGVVGYQALSEILNNPLWS
ncbi:hypothetical protein C1645_881072 [Glomus cerebriforme]|uniref:Uncharacterized protein n=1 Tax=Glomus cerebriforme TaxID=658196 RepID=A0A397SBZ0_9GLOM|nr:hypothetical protein C1645_881072 [Glomus cerebriforme]